MTLVDCETQVSKLRMDLSILLLQSVSLAVDAEPLSPRLVRNLRDAMAIVGAKEEWLSAGVRAELARLDEVAT